MKLAIIRMPLEEREDMFRLLASLQRMNDTKLRIPRSMVQVSLNTINQEASLHELPGIASYPTHNVNFSFLKKNPYRFR
jgi:hypothetical protein